MTLREHIEEIPKDKEIRISCNVYDLWDWMAIAYNRLVRQLIMLLVFLSRRDIRPALSLEVISLMMFYCMLSN